MTDKTPVTLLTGFLGSGKSTLLSQILQDPAFSKTAVIVNEFGEVGLDDFMVTHAKEQILEMTTGCLCCTIRGDISQTLLDLFSKRSAGEIAPFERVIIETTGLADPVPVIHTLTKDPEISDHFSLSGVVVTVDAANGSSTLDRQEECLKQVLVADRVVLTKTDLDIEEGQVTALRARLNRLNPTAQLLEKQSSDFQLETLFDTALFNEKTKSPDVQKWLNMENMTHNHGHEHHDHDHDHEHHHDINKHGDDIECFSLILDQPVSAQSFLMAIRLLIGKHGQHLLRIKGVVFIEEDPSKPFVLHGVQHVFHELIQLENWPSDDHRTKIVFITRELPKTMIEAYFTSWLDVDDARYVVNNG